MPLTLALAPLLAAAAPVQLPEPAITVTAHRWAPFISPMGEPFRARTRSDDTLALWFAQADRNPDGLLTADEMQMDAERFFARLDADGNGEIGPDELVAYEWEMAPEIQVNARWRQTAAQAAAASPAKKVGDRHGRDDQLPGFDDALQGAARYALLNLPQPVAAADTDFDRGISAAEFRSAARYRFGLLDRGRTGQLSLHELQALVPPPPKKGRAPRKGEELPDERIGVPLPPGN